MSRKEALVILFVAAVGLSIGLQGWRSRVPNWDLLPNIWDAAELIRAGRIPVKGTISSFGAFIPPGTTWLMAPGLLLAKDPRSFEFAGACALHLITLWGIFRLARRAFGTGAAYLAVVLFGFSKIGLFYSTSLWPRGAPSFYVWMVYWLQRWVTEKRPRALAIAVAIWATGLYISMEIAPAILLVPVLWYVYRPPIRAAPLVVAITGCLCIWLPYLSFEATREFSDLRAVIARHQVYKDGLPDGYRQTWCQPDLKLTDGNSSSQSLDEPPQSPVSASRGPVSAIGRAVSGGLYRWRVIVSNASGNFDVLPWIVGAKFALLLCCGSSLVALGMTSKRVRYSVIGWSDLVSRRVAWTLAAIFLAALFATIVLPRLLSPDGVLEPSRELGLWWLRGSIVVVAVVVLGRSAICAGFLKLASSVSIRPAASGGGPAFIAVALAIPWLALLLVTEPDRAERLWWLWSLQVIVLAGVASSISSGWKASSALHLLPVVSLVLVVCCTGTNPNRIRAWVAEGWSGVDADEVRVVDYLGHLLQGKTSATIGYEIYFVKWMPALHAVEARYRVGAEMDVLLAYRYGVQNADRCGEGIDVDDDYRIVETASPGGMRQARFELPQDRTRALVQEVGRFKVFDRHHGR